MVPLLGSFTDILCFPVCGNKQGDITPPLCPFTDVKNIRITRLFVCAPFDWSVYKYLWSLVWVNLRRIMVTHVEGLNVINDPKCNKVLNVITFCPKCNKLLRTVPTNGKYFFPDNDDVRQVDHISGYWNPKRKLGVTTHFFRDNCASIWRKTLNRHF